MMEWVGTVGRVRSSARRNLDWGERPWMLVGRRGPPRPERSSAPTPSSLNRVSGMRINRMPQAPSPLEARRLPRWGVNRKTTRATSERGSNTRARRTTLVSGNEATLGATAWASSRVNRDTCARERIPPML